MTGGSGAALPLRRFLLSLLSNQGLVDVGNDTCGEEGRILVKSLAEFPTNYNKSSIPLFVKIQCECRVDLPQCESREAASPCIYANCQIPIWFPIFPLLAKFPLTDGNTRMTPTSTSNGGFDQGVQLLITADRQLQVPGRDPLDFEILGSVPSQLQHLQDSRKRWECRGEGCWVWGGGSYLSGQVLEDGCTVHGCRGSHAPVAGGPSLQVPVDAADRELGGN